MQRLCHVISASHQCVPLAAPLAMSSPSGQTCQFAQGAIGPLQRIPQLAAKRLQLAGGALSTQPPAPHGGIGRLHGGLEVRQTPPLSQSDLDRVSRWCKLLFTIRCLTFDQSGFQIRHPDLAFLKLLMLRDRRRDNLVDRLAEVREMLFEQASLYLATFTSPTGEER